MFKNEKTVKMKKLFVLALLAVFGMSAFAQEEAPAKKSFFKQLEYTVNAGFGTSVTNAPYDSQIFSFDVGLDVKKDIKSFYNDKLGLYGLVGFHVSRRGGTMSNEVLESTESGNSVETYQYSIPLHVGLKYKFKNNWRLFFDFGPYIGINPTVELSEGYGHTDYELKSKSMDAGIGGNFGVCFKKFGISIGFEKGFLDIAKFSSESEDISTGLKTMVAFMKFQWTFNKQ